MGDQEPTRARIDAVREEADEDVADEAKGVVAGPEGPGGAAGPLEPQGGVSGGETHPDD
jgi:hypothetical protein